MLKSTQSALLRLDDDGGCLNYHQPPQGLAKEVRQRLQQITKKYGRLRIGQSLYQRNSDIVLRLIPEPNRNTRYEGRVIDLSETEHISGIAWTITPAQTDETPITPILQGLTGCHGQFSFDVPPDAGWITLSFHE